MIVNGNDPATQPSFTLSNRVARSAWGLVWLTLFRPSPRPMHAWRAMLLRLFRARVGQHVHVYPSARIWAPWQLEIGNRVGIADGVTLYNMARIAIGDGCVISQGAHLCAGSHDYNSSNFQLIAKPIILEDHVWVCAEAFVGLGVTIPQGCVLAARAVLAKSPTATWTVYAGVPAIAIKTRARIVSFPTSY